MLRTWLIGINAAWIAGLIAFCFANNVSVGGYAFTALGTTLRDAGLTQAAVASYSAALYFIPTASRVHGARAYAYMMGKDYPAALTGYNHALELEGPNVSRYHARGNLYFTMRRYDDAIADYKAAVMLDPQQADLHRALAATYIRKNDMASAAAEYRKVSRMGLMNHGETYYLNFTTGFARGDAAMRLGHYDRAVAEFSALHKLRNPAKAARLANDAFRQARCRRTGDVDCEATLAAHDARATQLAKANGFDTESPRLATDFNLGHDLLQKAQRAFAVASERIEAKDFSGAMKHLNEAVQATGVTREGLPYLAARAKVREILGDDFRAYSDREQAGYRETYPTLRQRFEQLEAQRKLEEKEDD